MWIGSANSIRFLIMQRREFRDIGIAQKHLLILIKSLYYVLQRRKNWFASSSK